MNTGIVDAVVLGRLLADVVKGKRPEARPRHYGEKRRPAATKVLGMAGAHHHGNSAKCAEAEITQCRAIADQFVAASQAALADESFRTRT